VSEPHLNIEIINKSKIKISKVFVKKWLMAAKLSKMDLTIVFLDTAAAKKINREFRGKNYATDILSFDGGELVLCPQVLKRQAKEHRHSFNAELGYMLIHGVLHLKGFDHEKSKSAAAKMFKIQDQVFDRLCAKFEI
jgi:probable rRNA maturation factor